MQSEKIFTELFKNKIKINPPKIAKGTANTMGDNELNVAATQICSDKAKAKIINNSLLVSLISSDFPFQVIWFSEPLAHYSSKIYCLIRV